MSSKFINSESDKKTGTGTSEMQNYNITGCPLNIIGCPIIVMNLSSDLFVTIRKQMDY